MVKELCGGLNESGINKRERELSRTGWGRESGCFGIEVAAVLRKAEMKELEDCDKEAGSREVAEISMIQEASKGFEMGKVMRTQALTRNKAQLFPTTRRLEKRLVATEESVSREVIDQWFASTALHLGSQLKQEQVLRAKRMLYTWRDVFETDLLRIRRTDLIEHAIVLTPDAKPYRAQIPLYSEEEIAFCRRLLPKMEEAGLIFRCDTEWGARTKFPL